MTTDRLVLAEPRIALAFGVDGMSLVMMLLTAVVTVAAVLMAEPPADGGRNARLACASPLLISAGALGAFLSTDLFFFFAFHELALIPTFLMIGMMGHGPDRMGAAWRITIYLGLGSLVVLVGLLGLVAASGGDSFSMAALRELAAGGAFDASEQRWIYGVLLVGFGILISLFPFHSWAAPAYAAAPAPVAMMHAGVLKKFGLYGLLRVAMPLLPDGHESWVPWLLVLLLGNILYIGLITISQDRLDRMLGFSSVMHMGYVFLGLASGNAVGLSGALLLMFAHGVSVALLFGLTGAVRQGVPTLDLLAMGGLGRAAPALCFAFGIGAFASIGLPGFANFSAELLVFFGGFKGYAGGGLNAVQVTTVLALWGVVISAVYMLRAFRRVFLGEPLAERSLPDLGASGRAGAGLLLVVLLVVGIWPSLLLDVLTGPVQTILGQR
jgi:NADH-quinone oxidoreductase subunit M